MNKIIIIILTFYFYTGNAQTKSSLSLNIENLNFRDFISLIEKEGDVNVFYHEKYVSDVSINLKIDSASVIDILQLALKETNLKVSPWNDNFVILPEEKLITQLPNFKQQTDDSSANILTDITLTEQRYIKGRKADVVQTIVVGNKNSHQNGKVKVVGKILDMDTGEPIIGATIYVEETKAGAATDLNGYFIIILNQGKYNTRFSSLGYETGKYFLNVYSDGTVRVELKSATFSLQEAVIRGDRQMDIKFKDPCLEKLTAKSIKAIPMMMGERDILKVSEMLPGIISVGEGSSGLNVRGGSSDQNAFYINKIPIYNTSHLFGFFPAFNSDILKDFSIYKGHIPAEFGGRLSSVFNVTTRQGNRKNFSLHGGINPIAANVTVEGPIKQDKSSVLLSARSSYSDWILSRIKDPVIRTSSANFNDFSLGLNYDFEKTLLSTFIYNSNDKFDLSSLNSYKYSNAGASINLYHSFSNLLRVNIALIGSQYSFNTKDMQEVSSAYQHSYSINHYEIRTDFTQTLGEKNELNFGLSAINYKLNRGSIAPYGEESLRNTIEHGEEQGLETALYISDKYDITPWLNISAGLRYSLYAPLGEKKIYLYEDNQPREFAYINDSLNFTANQAIKWYKSPEIRFSVNLKTDGNGTVKFAYNQMSQNLFMLNNTITIAPNTQWKLADYHIKPSKSSQLTLGIFRNIPYKNLEGSVEVFYKKTEDITEFKDGADFLNNPLIEAEILQGDQESYGIELLLKKPSGIINGWLAYTYSRSFIHVTGDQSWEQINNGKEYPSNYDIPHVFNAVLNYNFSKRITLSTALTYQKGKPVTYPVSIYYIDNTPIIDYNERNKYRIPDYFRTDLSLTIEGNLKKNKLIHSSWMFSVYNLTGRNNAYSVYFVSEEGKIKSYKYSVIGTPFITITWLFKLGNYAAQ
ncbi:MAG: hypothetical protein C0597_16640 [Marinilabiliales bacterium]|nr:MAG: hypothetical protein C0597_16640 [Marinilabiliales bacterium]